MNRVGSIRFAQWGFVHAVQWYIATYPSDWSARTSRQDKLGTAGLLGKTAYFAFYSIHSREDIAVGLGMWVGMEPVWWGVRERRSDALWSSKLCVPGIREHFIQSTLFLPPSPSQFWLVTGDMWSFHQIVFIAFFLYSTGREAKQPW